MVVVVVVVISGGGNGGGIERKGWCGLVAEGKTLIVMEETC